MSRAGYSDDCDDNWSHIMWRGSVASATRGKRGQAFFKDLLAALDAMPEKKLIANDLIRDGEVCAIGSVGLARGVDLAAIDPEDYDKVADTFGIAPALVREIEYMNDEGWWRGHESPQIRWCRMRAWVSAQIKQDASK